MASCKIHKKKLNQDGTCTSCENKKKIESVEKKTVPVKVQTEKKPVVQDKPKVKSKEDIFLEEYTALEEACNNSMNRINELERSKKRLVTEIYHSRNENCKLIDCMDRVYPKLDYNGKLEWQDQDSSYYSSSSSASIHATSFTKDVFSNKRAELKKKAGNLYPVMKNSLFNTAWEYVKCNITNLVSIENEKINRENDLIEKEIILESKNYNDLCDKRTQLHNNMLNYILNK